MGEALRVGAGSRTLEPQTGAEQRPAPAGRPGQDDTRKDIATLEERYRMLWDCMVRKNAAGLEDVCADDYVLHHMTGMRQGKRAFIDAVADGTLTYYAAKHDSVSVSLGADPATAVVVGRTRVDAAVFGGGRSAWHLENRLRARCDNGVWRFADHAVRTY